MIFLNISPTRFYFEYQHYIQNYDNRFIEWNVDIDNNLIMYIITDKGFGFKYQCKANDIPEILKPLIKKNGEFFGFADDNKAIEETPVVFEKIKLDNKILDY